MMVAKYAEHHLGAAADFRTPPANPTELT